jgi:tetraacyldisaccharide 4'-kinase
MPFGFFYILAVYIRNFLFDRGILNSFEFDIPVISVGNLRAGGTGKTPMIEYLIRNLSGKYKVCTLSRGYGRSTSGYKLADEKDSPSTIGDEPYQFLFKFKKSINVAVAEDRFFAIPNILADTGSPSVILLDDAYQHRSVRASFNILLTSWSDPFYVDFPLPYGLLREQRSGAKRADCIIVTRCPADLTQSEMDKVKDRINEYAPHKEVFFSLIEYGDPVSFGAINNGIEKNLLLVTGIADSKPLEDYLCKKYTVLRHLKFNDHNHYTLHDCRTIRNTFNSLNVAGKSILVTEKDMVKLKSEHLSDRLGGLPMFYIPIVFKFAGNGRIFDQKTIDSIKKFQFFS